MVIFQHIREQVGEYFLMKQYTPGNRRRAIMNMDAAKSIGILYCGDNPMDVEMVKKYSDMLGKQGKEVKTLGFIHVKEVPPSLNGSVQHNYFSLKELNWYFKPSSAIIDNFAKEEFDILLDLNISQLLPLTFISSFSRSRCKTGRYMEKYANLYDVMLETDVNPNLEYFVKNMYHYLDKLNKKAS